MMHLAPVEKKCWSLPKDMECSKTFWVVFVGLILMTAGFFLTMAGWFAPPINQGVYGVRMAGPVALVFGLVLLLCSCLMCAVLQGRCFSHCVHLFQEKKSVLKAKFGSHPSMLHDHYYHHHCPYTCANSTISNAAAHHHDTQEAEYVFGENSMDEADDNGYLRGQHCGRPATLVIRGQEPTCVVNENARELHESPQHKRKKKRHRSRKEQSKCSERSASAERAMNSLPMSSSGIIIPCPSTPHYHPCQQNTCGCQESPLPVTPRHASPVHRTSMSPSYDPHSRSPSLSRHKSAFQSPRTHCKETQINGDSGNGYHQQSSSARGPGLAQSSRANGPAQQPFSTIVFTRQPSTSIRSHQSTLLPTYDISSTSGESYRQNPSPFEIQSDV